MDDFKKVFVIGTGISGINAANFLNKHGKTVILYDSNDSIDKDKVRDQLDNKETEIIAGNLSDSVIDSADLLIPSPGVFPESEIFQRFVRKDIPIWGEIELAYRFEKGKVIAITGTNGKTTTTTLVGEMVKAWNEKTFVVGNIGYPYTNEVDKTSEDSYSVAEISSYQLETMIGFHPVISAITNITPDHMDRHHTMDEYERVKESITKNQTKSDTCILNYDDERLRKFGEEKCPASVIWFGRKKQPENGFYLVGDHIYLVRGKQKAPILNINQVKLLGDHNYENIMVALGVAMALGMPLDIALSVIKNFNAVEHRIEFVANINDVDYYNDSKGTNPDAAIKAIEAMRKPVVLIAGGYDKGVEFDEYIKAFGDKVKEVVVLGQTADKIIETAKKYNFTNIKKVGTLEEAVSVCKADAVPGDCVLLSPACASWGMFTNFEERGRLFKEYVKA
ncbi:MAG: UDP-N-acetylmuramoyl-L-alanine--D-glutamate ligase [Clostridiales bacterium]|nr:UDP-N-acetylmuramoyl-L-alanine--D-glutamate ligase [Clostridiales bacterium]MDU1042436.1 UDP-N-acetylmuramoyl-L-alanine--D-glutamate ligase [Clostridiales bacterium]MDU3490038.1 UDP-N-acetylmuramoyl-L-alanine--D-glutamate ligase [Clostridiales bacterium]